MQPRRRSAKEEMISAGWGSITQSLLPVTDSPRPSRGGRQLLASSLVIVVIDIGQPELRLLNHAGPVLLIEGDKADDKHTCADDSNGGKLGGHGQGGCRNLAVIAGGFRLVNLEFLVSHLVRTSVDVIVIVICRLFQGQPRRLLRPCYDGGLSTA